MGHGFILRFSLVRDVCIVMDSFATESVGMAETKFPILMSRCADMLPVWSSMEYVLLEVGRRTM